MPIRATLRVNLYKDSVALMRLAEMVVERTGVKRATLLMGTPGNKDILAKAGMLDAGVEDANPSDIMIVVEDERSEMLDKALAEIGVLIESEPANLGERKENIADPQTPRSLGMALVDGLDANIAQISVPGLYAGAEAMKAVRHGLNVFLFSDNVPLDQERAFKELAARKNLLVMGPDCGTAIIAGVPFGFANAVRRGPIGLVGASGTGLQAVSSYIHRLGSGVSHAIGTGSRDVHAAIGGISMLRGLKLLIADSATRVIAIVSKPPAVAVRDRILAQAQQAGKPVIACFLEEVANGGKSAIHHVATLEEAAFAAVALAASDTAPKAVAREVVPPRGRLASSQRYLRGLYSGGTFCYEAQLVWRRLGIVALSNAPLDPKHKLEEGAESRGHCAIDLGSDEFTVGRPHPMIDYGTRIERLRREAADSSVAAVVLDVVLGYGSHEDPAGILAPVIRQVREQAAKTGRDLAVICFVCGTEEDSQRLSLQQEKLHRAGAWLAESSGEAAHAAASILGHATVG